MADTISAFHDMKIDLFFVDGDTRTITVRNPNTEAEGGLEARLAELNSYIAANNLLIGDKNGATFGRIQKATTIQGTTRKLDLTE